MPLALPCPKCHWHCHGPSFITTGNLPVPFRDAFQRLSLMSPQKAFRTGDWPKQLDSHSCGVYVLELARRVFLGHPLLPLDDAACCQWRRAYTSRLMQLHRGEVGAPNWYRLACTDRGGAPPPATLLYSEQKWQAAVFTRQTDREWRADKTLKAADYEAEESDYSMRAHECNNLSATSCC